MDGRPWDALRGRSEMSHRATILVAEDQPGVRSFLAAALEDANFAVLEAEDGAAAIALLEQREFDVVLTDLRMPKADGMAVLARARAIAPETAVIVLTAFGSIERAVEAMRLGAADFLTKPVESPAVLVLAVERALGERHLRRENERLRRDATPVPGFDAVVHEGPAMRGLLKLARAVAPTRSTVLLTGESGTGKEVLARAIHTAGAGPEAPFVAVNCAALPGDLLESELFGHERGAFTGASAVRVGRFELAGEGTLFLDEVGELPAPLQAKLLRVLQEGTFERVGGTRTLRFPGRIIAATNRDLRRRVAEGGFREDLFYRLNVFPLHLPPLRERPEDILPLATHLLRGLAVRVGKPPLRLDPEAATLLSRYPWPGNVRELANVLERAAILATDDRIVPDLLPVELTDGLSEDGTTSGDTLQDLERRAILEAIAAEGGNRRKASERLGISLRTLQYRLREYGVAGR